MSGRRFESSSPGSAAGDEFPPKAGHPHEIAQLSEAFACTVSGRTAWYVSSPLTSGERSLEWRRRYSEHGAKATAQLSESFRRDVLALNRGDAARFVEGLRARTTQVVINPSALADIPHWTQSDYRVLWASVIERYVSTVVFRDGWQHSNGCAWELLTAYVADRRLLREDLSPLGIAEAQTLVETAISAVGERQATAFLVAVFDALNDNRKDREWHASS